MVVLRVEWLTTHRKLVQGQPVADPGRRRDERVARGTPQSHSAARRRCSQETAPLSQNVRDRPEKLRGLRGSGGRLIEAAEVTLKEFKGRGNLFQGLCTLFVHLLVSGET